MDDKDKLDGFAQSVANGLKAKGKMEKEKNKARNNRLWLWFGIIILIAILIWWLFSIGTLDAIIGTANG